jgi:single-stranded-DNA-specific exonuclease
VITCAELHAANGRELFDDLLLLEPYGMGNPAPKLLIRNCEFKNIKNKNIQDFKKRTVQYIRTTFELIDQTNSQGFPGMWWGHYEHEIPRVNCDAIVELDFNSFEKRFEVRLIEVRPAATDRQSNGRDRQDTLQIIDFRQVDSNQPELANLAEMIQVQECPSEWGELRSYSRQAMLTRSKLALNYQSTNLASSQEVFEQLIGIAKYLVSTSKEIELDRWRSQLKIGDRTLKLGLDALVQLGFEISLQPDSNRIKLTLSEQQRPADLDLFTLVSVREFLAAIEEERFNRDYFLSVPVYAIESNLSVTNS